MNTNDKRLLETIAQLRQITKRLEVTAASGKADNIKGWILSDVEDQLMTLNHSAWMVLESANDRNCY